MDLKCDVGENVLNIRAAGVIIHNNKILVHRNINHEHYALIGGKIVINESSVDAVKREFWEEMEKEVDVQECIAVVENFFNMKGKRYHEIMFIHKVEFVDEQDKLIDYTLDNIEGKDYLKYMWLDLDKIDEYKILPKVTKEILKEKNLPIHRINID